MIREWNKEIERMENEEWEYCRENFGEDCGDCIQRTEELLDFANMVFSMEYSSTDFAALLPKAYSQERCAVPVHHIIRESGRVRALIDTYPVILGLQGKSSRTVKAAYVGTVSVHPSSRGRGYMTRLMGRVEEDAREQGCVLMILDGERHRYQHYGFEHAGICYSFFIETGNIKHCCADIYGKECMDSAVYSFEELEEHSPYLDKLYQLYQRRAVTVRSRDDFWLCLQGYNASAHVILRSGEPIGYLDLSENMENVLEIEIDRVSDLCRVLYDLMMAFDMTQLCISVGMDEQDKIRELEKACDRCKVSMSHQVKILDHEAVLAFLLDWKQEFDTLAIGEYVIGVRDDQTGVTENYLLSITADKISVSRTDKAADTVLDPMELVRVLTTSFCFVEQQKGSRNRIKNAPVGWFPLPFYLPEADTF